MKALAQWLVIAVLAGVYLLTLFSLVHLKVSQPYRATFIDHTSTDWVTQRYSGTPQEGMDFSRKGLPEWVNFVSGLSSREALGRWTDAEVGKVPELVFTRSFNGPNCLELTASPASSLIGKSFAVRMDGETIMLKVLPRDLAEYRVQFSQLRSADSLDFLLPDGLPRQSETDPKSTDRRRLGLELAKLRILPGDCPESSQ